MAEDEKAIPGDEGELEISVIRKEPHVFLNFGKPVQWVGFHKDDLAGFIRILRKHLKEMK